MDATDYSRLRAELDGDLEGLGYAGLNDADAAEVLNRPADHFDPPRSWTKPVPVTISQLRTWGATTGVRKAIGEAAADPDHPGKAIALTLLDTLQDSGTPPLDFERPDFGALIEALEVTGLISPAEKVSLRGLGRAPASRAEALGFGEVAYWDVARARALEN